MASIRFAIGSVRYDENNNEFDGNITIDGYYFNVPKNAYGFINTTIQEPAWKYITTAIEGAGIENIVMISTAVRDGVVPICSGYTFKQIRFYCSSGTNYGKTYTCTNTTGYPKDSSGSVLVPHDGERYLIYYDWVKSNTTSYTLKVDGNGQTFSSTVSNLVPAPSRGYNSSSINWIVSSKTTVTLPTQSYYLNVPSNTTLLGYATSATGSKSYNPGATYTISASATLYAVWQTSGSTTSKGTIVFNPNCGTGGPGTITGDIGSSINLSSYGKPTRAGDASHSQYTFIGWNRNTSSQTVIYQPNASVPIQQANDTLYAVWDWTTSGSSGSSTTSDVKFVIGDVRKLDTGGTFTGTVTINGNTFNPSKGASGTNSKTGTYYVYEAIAAAIKNSGINNLSTITAALQNNIKPVCSGYTFSKFEFYCSSGTNLGKTFTSTLPASWIKDSSSSSNVAKINAGETYTISFVWTKNSTSTTTPTTGTVTYKIGDLVSIGGVGYSETVWVKANNTNVMFSPSKGTSGTLNTTGSITAYEAISAATIKAGTIDYSAIVNALKSGAKPFINPSGGKSYIFQNFQLYCTSGTNKGKTYTASAGYSYFLDSNSVQLTTHAGETYEISLIWWIDATIINYNLAIDSNGGEFQRSVTSITPGKPIMTSSSLINYVVPQGDIKLPTADDLKYAGYTLLGYGDDPKSNVFYHTPGSTFKVVKNETKYAIWSKNPEKKVPEITWVTQSQTLPYGTTQVTLKWKITTGADYLDVNSTGVQCTEMGYRSGSSIGNGEWTCTFDLQGRTRASFTASADCINSDTQYHTPIKSTTIVIEVSTVDTDKFVLEIDANGGTFGNVSGLTGNPTKVSDTLIRYTQPQGKTVKLPTAAQLTSAGRTLAGYGNDTSNSVFYHPPGDSFTIAHEYEKKYAVWNQNSTNVTFYPNLSGLSPEIKLPNASSFTSFKTAQYVSYKEAQPFGSLPDAQCTGYTFKGWYTSATGGTKISIATTVTANMAVYAQWEMKGFAKPVWVTVNGTQVKRGQKIALTWKKGDPNDKRPTWYGVYLYNPKTGNNIKEVSRKQSDGSEYQLSIDWTVPDDYKGGACFRVISDDGQGTASPWSDVLTLGWNKGVAPSKPAGCWINKSKVPPTIFKNWASFSADKQEEYKYHDVSWSASTDADNDLYGYVLEKRTTDDGTNWSSWNAVGLSSWTYAICPKSKLNTQMFNSILSKSAIQCQYRVAAVDSIYYETLNSDGIEDTTHMSEWTESNVVSISEKKPPSVPSPVTIPTKIKANEQFQISWGSSTDADGDLAGYRLEECRNGSGEWANSSNHGPNVNYTYRTLPKDKTLKTIQYRVKAYDALGLESGYAYSATRDVITNTPPQPPPYINVPAYIPPKDLGAPNATGAVKAGEKFTITWGQSFDADNNLAGYELQRMLDRNGRWETIATPNREFYTETIDKTQAYHSAVRYRVRAFDEEKEYSDWTTSSDYNVSNNASPVVTTNWPNGTHIGTMEHGFSFNIHVTDEENDRVDVEVAIIPEGATEDAKIVLATFEDRATPMHSIYTITEDDFTALPMQRFTVIITAMDAEGYGKTSFSFTRKATRAFLTLKYPMTYPEFIEGVKFTRLYGQFPTDCIMKVEVTNNANDRAGTVVWEDCTAYARNLMAYEFKNKIAFRPAFNFRITLNRGASGASGYISRVSGYFITENTEQQF